jgi:hypothetical protein
MAWPIIFDFQHIRGGIWTAIDRLGFDAPSSQLSPAQRALTTKAQPLFVATSLTSDEGFLVLCEKGSRYRVRDTVGKMNVSANAIVVAPTILQLLVDAMRATDEPVDEDVCGPQAMDMKEWGKWSLPRPPAPLHEASFDKSRIPTNPGTLFHPHNCKPCAFNCRKRCANGADCEFCHHPSHPRTRGKRRNRKRGEDSGSDNSANTYTDDSVEMIWDL